MKEYSDIFFDLDRTLWDFDKNSSETLEELFHNYKLDVLLDTDLKTFITNFQALNAVAWKDFRKGEVTKEEMRANRFVQLFFKYGSSDWKTARKLSIDYMSICPHKPYLVDGVKTLLDQIQEKYKLHIITNGFSDSQWNKINGSGLKAYMHQIIISDETSFRKPDKRIFQHALKKARAKKETALMVGDDWKNDILGAMTAGMDQAFYNPADTPILKEEPTIKMIRMSDLSNYL